MNPLYAAMPTTIFEEVSGLARARGAINLGQGFPDGPGPRDVLEAAATAILTGSNQYPPSRGLLETREAVADHYRRHQQLDVPSDQVLITSGATEALAASLLAILSPGDEILLLEPMYDAYLPLVRQAGGVARLITLRPPHWRLPIGEIEAAIGPRTRAILLNNPLNPAARAFDRDELEQLAALCVRHDLIAVCDEVWEHIVFDDRRHVPLIGLDGMARRSVKVGSAGKMFALTGWKVGFAVACPDLLDPIARAHQFLTFTTPPNLQAAVAYALGKEPSFFDASRTALRRSRDRLSGALSAGGFVVLPSEGTYFIVIDLVASGLAGDDRALCRRMIDQCGVAAIPLSAFYASGRAPVGHVRLCFAKEDAVLDEAAERMIAWRRTTSGAK